MSRPDVRMAVDIGGTFTDIVLDRGSTRITRKVLTTQRPEEGVLSGARLVLGDAGLHFSDIDVFIHGTTLATNAIIERRGARTALIATAGFRGTLSPSRNRSRWCRARCASRSRSVSMCMARCVWHSTRWQLPRRSRG